MEDEEPDELVQAVRVNVEPVFGVGDRKSALQSILDSNSEAALSDRLGHDSTYFIPISAIYAFIHRCASGITFDRFQKFELSLVDRLGRHQFGKQVWKRLTSESKYKAVFEVINKPDQKQEGLSETNCSKVLAACHFVLRMIIQGQLEIELSDQSEPIQEKEKGGRKHYKQGSRIFISGLNLKPKFWQLYNEIQCSGLAKFQESPKALVGLSKAFDELEAYCLWVEKNHWIEEKKIVAKSAGKLVQGQLEILFTKYFSRNSVQHRKTEDSDLSWQTLSEYDWKTVFNSICLLSFHQGFCERFGEEKILMESQILDLAMRINQDKCPRCQEGVDGRICFSCNLKVYPAQPSSEAFKCCGARVSENTLSFFSSQARVPTCFNCGMKHMRKGNVERTADQLRCKYVDGKFVPVDPTAYEKIVHIGVPKSFSDPYHFGHLMWRYCNLIAATEASGRE